MNGFCQHIFSGSGFTGNQDRRIILGNQGNRFKKPRHFLAPSDDMPESICLLGLGIHLFKGTEVFNGFQKTGQVTLGVLDGREIDEHRDSLPFPVDHVGFNANRFRVCIHLLKGAFLNTQLAPQDVKTEKSGGIAHGKSADRLKGSIYQNNPSIRVEHNKAQGDFIGQGRQIDGEGEKAVNL